MMGIFGLEGRRVVSPPSLGGFFLFSFFVLTILFFSILGRRTEVVDELTRGSMNRLCEIETVEGISVLGYLLDCCF